MRMHILAFALASTLAAAGVFAQETDPSRHAAHSAHSGEDRDHGKGKAATGHGDVDHSAMDHTGMDHSTMDHAAMGHAQSASAEPRMPIPPVTDADRAAAFPSGVHDVHMHGHRIDTYLLVDRLEAFDADPGSGQAWEAKGWLGGDIDRVWLRSEGERVRNRLETADLELLWGHAVTPWWDFVAGVRQDFEPGAAQTSAAIGVQGLAPQKFEVSATAYVGERGQVAARFETEYELLLTNRLILQPRVELDLYGRDDARRHVGAGLATAEAGLRLRYEITRRFAPHVGLVHERAFGDTADYRRHESGRARDTRVVAGLRLWF